MTDDGVSPLHIAAESGHYLICKMIMENIVDKNPRGKFGLTPLHLAADRGHIEICKLFVEQGGVFPNPKCDKGLTPLHYGALKSQGNICQYLKTFIVRPKVAIMKID